MVIHICDDKNKEKGKRCNLTCHRSIFSPCKFETLKNSQLHGYDDPSFELLRCVNLHRDVHIYIYALQLIEQTSKSKEERVVRLSTRVIQFFSPLCVWLTPSRGKTRSGYTLAVFLFGEGKMERWLRPRSTSRPIRRCSKFFETTLPTHLRTHFLLPRRRRRRRIRSIGKIFCRHFTTLPPRYKYCLHYFIVNNYYRTVSKINLKVSPHRRQVFEDPRFEFGKLTREYTKFD